ncbi:MAG: hypothetical protein IKN49_03565 [Elusimicrobiaceae bacterium]|nr:hypothetical protein [Elusimicrobiaceae bacterium]
MKIPSYQTQVAYKAAPVRSVRLVPTVSGKPNKWEKIGIVNQLIQNGREIYDGVRNIIQARNKQSAAGRSSNSEAELLSPTLPKKAETAPATASPFSDPARRALFEEGVQYRAGGNLPVHNLSTAVETLDNYVNTQAQGKGVLPGEKEPLWIQDYVIIRRELQHLQQQEQQQTDLSTFEQAAQHFVQTAGLVRSTKALEEYVQDNLAAAEQEAVQQGVPSEVWQRQKTQLYAQAVNHNVRAALQAGEIAQAQAVAEHFSAQVPSWQQQDWQAQIKAARAEQILTANWPDWQVSCRDEQGKLNKEQIQHLLQEKYGGTQLEEPLQRSFEQRWQQYQQQCWQKQAQYYAQCLQGEKWPLSDELEGQIPEQKELSRQLLTQYRGGDNTVTNVEVFNSLYEQILAGNAQESELDQAFQTKQLSAQDTLRLKKYFCEGQAGSADTRQKILSSSLAHFCHQYDLTEQQMQLAKYWVYAAGTTVKDQLHAAHELKQMFALQEKNK